MQQVIKVLKSAIKQQSLIISEVLLIYGRRSDCDIEMSLVQQVIKVELVQQRQ